MADDRDTLKVLWAKSIVLGRRLCALSEEEREITEELSAINKQIEELEAKRG